MKEGQQVRRGDVLGTSGGTHYPHLHFGVSRRLGEGKRESLPIRFGRRGRPGYLPKRGQFYGNPGISNATLKLVIDGQTVDPEKPVSLARGGKLTLTAQLISATGGAEDVTEDERTRIESVTPWSMQVDEEGVVLAGPGEGFSDLPEPDDPMWKQATVAVFFVDPANRRLGIQKAEFALE